MVLGPREAGGSGGELSVLFKEQSLGFQGNLLICEAELPAVGVAGSCQGCHADQAPPGCLGFFFFCLAELF